VRAEKEPAFILHQRAYSETSVILDIFSKNHGRLSLIAKGAKKQVSNRGSVLNQFQLLMFSWSGKSDLKTMTNAETADEIYQINPDAVYCGFYINELIIRLLHQNDPHPELFDYYNQIIKKFCNGMSEKLLRVFEKKLLIEIGYGVILDHDINNNAIDVDADYYYLPEEGPVKVADRSINASMIKGKNLLALANEKFGDRDDMMEIKKLMRTLLQIQLGEKPLQSRKLMNDLMAINSK
jgi:DNA repair protein RecO (recombination protein O)